MPYRPQRSPVRPGHREATDRPQVTALRGRSYGRGRGVAARRQLILCRRHASLYHLAHGSLEGVGGLKTNEAYHSKADALVIPKMYFFKIYLRFFGNVGFVNSAPFPLC